MWSAAVCVACPFASGDSISRANFWWWRHFEISSPAQRCGFVREKDVEGFGDAKVATLVGVAV